MENQPYDPTRNVLQLVEAAIKRVDDLREAETRRVDEALKTHTSSIKELMNAESLRINENAHHHFEHIQSLMEAEAKRLNAIREIDTNTLENANTRVAQQASIVAKQLSEATETLREQITTSTETESKQRMQSITQLDSRIKLLEQNMHSLSGQSGGRKDLWVLITGGVLFAMAIAGFVLNLVLH